MDGSEKCGEYIKIVINNGFLILRRRRILKVKGTVPKKLIKTEKKFNVRK